MYIMRCDRCGNEVEVNSPFQVLTNDQENLNYIPRYLISDFCDTKTITLCQKCERDFTDFLNTYKAIIC